MSFLIQLLINFYRTFDKSKYRLHSVSQGVLFYQVIDTAWTEQLENADIAAFALGSRVFISGDTPITPSLLAHERTHVQQHRADYLFPIKYALAHIKYGYHNNPYEVAAREAENT